MCGRVGGSSEWVAERVLGIHPRRGRNSRAQSNPISPIQSNPPEGRRWQAHARPHAPLEVAGDGDVHGRRRGLRHLRLVVLPRAEEAVQDVVHVRRHQLGWGGMQGEFGGERQASYMQTIHPSLPSSISAPSVHPSCASSPHQLLHGEAHALGVVPRQDVPKVARRHREGQLSGGVFVACRGGACRGGAWRGVDYVTLCS